MTGGGGWEERTRLVVGFLCLIFSLPWNICEHDAYCTVCSAVVSHSIDPMNSWWFQFAEQRINTFIKMLHKCMVWFGCVVVAYFEMNRVSRCCCNFHLRKCWSTWRAFSFQFAFAMFYNSNSTMASVSFVCLSRECILYTLTMRWLAYLTGNYTYSTILIPFNSAFK